MRAWLASSIIHKFAAAASAIALVMGLMAGGASYLLVRAQVWQSITDRLEGVAQLTARRGELIIEHTLADLGALARNPILANALVDSHGREAYLEPLLRASQSQNVGTKAVGLYDFSGQPYVLDGVSHPVAKGDPVILSAASGKAAARIDGDSLIIALPVIYPATRQPEGALAILVSLEAVLARAGTGIPKEIHAELSWAGIIEPRTAEGRMVAQEPLLLAPPIADMLLSVKVGVDEASALRPLTTVTIIYILIGIVTTLFVFGLALAVGRRLARPLTELSTVARAVAVDGRFDHEITLDGHDEVSNLALALREMLGRLEGAQRDLEFRVDERTEALRTKELELTLQASRLSAILENVVDGIVSIDHTGTMLSVNQATERLFGWSASEMTGRNVSMLMPEPHHSAHDGYIRRYLTTGESRVIGAGRQLEGRRRDGTLFPMELAVSFIEGACPIFVGVVRDISDRVAAQTAMAAAKEAAEEANVRKSEFLATMTHEIRTPMNGVLGMLNVLLDGTLTPEQQRNATIAHRSANSLLALINDILDFSKMEAGHLLLDVGDFDITNLITEIVEIIETTARGKGLVVQTMIADDIPRWLKGDRARLLQILLNLMSNAVKFTDDGKVTLAVTGQGKHIRFDVTDTGIGISDTDQSLLFTRFTQVQGSYTRKYGGTGLGLAISKRLVEAMGGEIGVTSEAAKGSTFWFTVPLEQGVPQTRQGAAATGGWHFTGTVLVADDSETNQLVATSLLKRTGLTVDCVDNGLAALNAVQRGNYDLVLMDVAMPEMDGLAATKAIRALPGHRSQIPIIAMTAFAMTGDSDRCLEAGMDDFVTKPFAPDLLFGKIASWLGSRCDVAPNPSISPPSGAGVLDDAAIDRMEADTDADTTRRIAGKVLEEMLVRAARLDQAVESGDMAIVTREAHTLKSLAATFGSDALRILAEEMEENARSGGDRLAERSPALLEAADRTAEALRKRFGL